jgi:hypothetical protein
MKKKCMLFFIIIFLFQSVITIAWAFSDDQNEYKQYQNTDNNTDASIQPVPNENASADIEDILFDVAGMESVDQAYTCTATLDENLSLHVPLLSYLIPPWGAPSFWADMVYASHQAYPETILFKLTNAGIVQGGSYECNPSTLSDEVIVHIQDMLLPNGFSHVWAYLEYLPNISSAQGAYFRVVKYGLITN